jgi:uncharacterized protein YfkK (UPF0435 family)
MNPIQGLPNLGNMGAPSTGATTGDMQLNTRQPNTEMMGSSPLGGMQSTSNPVGVSPEGASFDPAEMDAFVAELRKKYQKYINTRELTSSKINQYKERILRDLYDFLVKNGIDPMDRNQISAFLADLEEQDPDVFDLIQMAIDSVLKFVESPTDMGPELPSPFSTGEQPQEVSPLEKFKNIAK